LSELLPDVREAQEAMNRLRSHSLLAYPGFTLAAFDLTQQDAPLVARWDGQRWQDSAARMPLCSSSFDTEAVLSSRTLSYQRQRPQTPQELWRWHTQEEQPSAYTVRMNRPDAQTWSISHVQIRPGGVHWRYRDEMPDLASAPVEHNLQLYT
jgi:hypothetical protein